MARQGREPHPETGGGGGWRTEGRGYGWEYRGFGRGRRRRPSGYGARTGYDVTEGYGAERGYGIEPGYGERVGYGAETGYGAGRGYGEEFGPSYGYDYEFGGRGWPYREGAERARWRGFARRRAARYAEEYGWGPPGPAEFDQRYGFEYRRPRRPWSGRPRARGAGWRGARGRGYRYGERYGMEGAPRGYEEEYAGPTYREEYAGPMYRGGRYAGRSFSAEGERVQPRYGRTPRDRWPDEGHDLDQRPRREREMSDGEIREAVLENLFQDTWIEPSRIEARVENGVVTLTGEVSDFMEARYAWDDAWESAGVRGVVNNLTVRTDRPQEEIELPQTAGSTKGRQGARR